MIKEIKYTFDNAGHPFLEFQWNGQPAKIASDQLKRSILNMGYVFLGPEWAGRLPQIEVPAKGGNNSFVLTGAVKDKDLANIALRFLDDLAAGLRNPSA